MVFCSTQNLPMAPVSLRVKVFFPYGPPQLALDSSDFSFHLSSLFSFNIPRCFTGSLGVSWPFHWPGLCSLRLLVPCSSVLSSEGLPDSIIESCLWSTEPYISGPTVSEQCLLLLSILAVCGPQESTAPSNMGLHLSGFFVVVVWFGWLVF